MAKILMFEDDLEFAELLSIYLNRFNIDVTVYEDPYLGLSSGISKFDLIILDLGLPGMDGLDVCQKIVKYNDTPIIISSARHELQNKVDALGYGADDYLAKPYDPQEMYARILSLLRRYKKINTPLEKDKNVLAIDKELKTVTFNDELLNLTPAEYDVMYQLNLNKGSLTSREQILGSSSLIKDKSLDVIINRLRQKMRDENKSFIRSVRGMGYILVV